MLLCEKLSLFIEARDLSIPCCHLNKAKRAFMNQVFDRGRLLFSIKSGKFCTSQFPVFKVSYQKKFMKCHLLLEVVANTPYQTVH